MNEAGRVEKCLRAALTQRIEELERDVDALHEIATKAEAGERQAWAEMESYQDALVEAEDKWEAFTEGDTMTYELAPEDRLALTHLEHRHNLLAERVDHKVGPALRDAARASHRSRWLLGFVFLLVSAAMLTWATHWSPA